MISDDKTTKQLDTAEELMQQGKYGEAIALYKDAHLAYPEEESVLLMLAWAYYDSGQISQSVEYWEILLEKELSRKVFTGFAFDELVRIYKQASQWDKLVTICTRAVKMQPKDVGLLSELGNAYLQAGRPKDACGIYKKLIEMENDNTANYCRYGEALFAEKLIQESETAYLKAAELDPEQTDRYLYRMAALFYDAGYFVDAHRLITKCLAANPQNALYYCFLGDVLIAREKQDEGCVAYERAARSDPMRAGAYYNRLGHTFMKAKQFSGAVAAFKSAIAHDAAEPYYRSLDNALKALTQAE